MSKYTVIYTRRWQTGSHWHALTKMERVEIECNESELMPKLVEIVGTEDIQYIFQGWPLLQGEKSIDFLSV